METTKSKGHLAFWGDYEMYDYQGAVYRAPVDNPIMPDGRRCGRWECNYTAFLNALSRGLYAGMNLECPAEITLTRPELPLE